MGAVSLELEGTAAWLATMIAMFYKHPERGSERDWTSLSVCKEQNRNELGKTASQHQSASLSVVKSKSLLLYR